MPFVKLDCGILDSSLWIDHDARTLFVTGLLMARPYVLEVPAIGLAVRQIEPSGFTVPPGEYGFIEAASSGIIQRAGIPRERGMEALCRLCDVDADSRTPDHEGRRLVRVDGGFIVLNFAKYREQDRTNAERQKRFRQRNKQPAAPRQHNGSNGVTPVTQPLLVTQAEAEAVLPKGNISPSKEGSPLPQAAGGEAPQKRTVKGKAIVALFHEICTDLPQVQDLTETRRKHLGARVRAAAKKGEPLEWFRRLFTLAHESDFVSGRRGEFRASFDWLLSPTNSQKVLEGNYKNESHHGNKKTTTGRNAGTLNDGRQSQYGGGVIRDSA